MSKTGRRTIPSLKLTHHGALIALQAAVGKAEELGVPQNITIVDPAHRGHRLGMVVKLENLRHAREHRPQLAAVDTANAASNASRPPARIAAIMPASTSPVPALASPAGAGGAMPARPSGAATTVSAPL